MQEKVLQDKINEVFLYLFKIKLLSLLDEYFAFLNICEKISMKLIQNLENFKKVRHHLKRDYIPTVTVEKNLYLKNKLLIMILFILKKK